MILLVNPGWAFAKSGSDDFIPHLGIDRITKILIEWKEALSRIIDHFDLKKCDYNFSPNRYIFTGDMGTYLPLAEIVVELGAVEAKAKEADKALRKILKRIGL